MFPRRSFVQIDDDGGRERASVEEFLLRTLLGSREEANLPSNEGGFDEDVNVYLVGLLEAFLSAAFHEEATRFHFPSDLDLVREVRRTDDERFTYRAYRVNADHLLLAIGLFQSIDGLITEGVFARSPRDFTGRAETYYRLASSSLRRLRRRTTGTEIAMTKLADRFEQYAAILARLRTSYFHLTARIGDGTLYHLANTSPDEEAAAQSRQLAYDTFLDAFTDWKRERSRQAYEWLHETARRVRERDENFAFKLPEESEIED